MFETGQIIVQVFRHLLAQFLAAIIAGESREAGGLARKQYP